MSKNSHSNNVVNNISLYNFKLHIHVQTTQKEKDTASKRIKH